MIYAGFSVDRWVNKYPALAECLPVCECEEPDLQAYLTHKTAGFECSVCKGAAWMASSAEGNMRNLDLVSPLIGED